MELDIKKENFSKENFDPKVYLNNLLKNDSESDLINFKLKILQREFSNDIDINTNNLLKFCKLLESDIQQTNLSNNMFLQNVNGIMNNKIEAKDLEELEKAFKIKNKNKNLLKALTYIEKS